MSAETLADIPGENIRHDQIAARISINDDAAAETAIRHCPMPKPLILCSSAPAYGYTSRVGGGIPTFSDY